jgi:hypothetical protein
VVGDDVRLLLGEFPQFDGFVAVEAVDVLVEAHLPGVPGEPK